MNAITAKAKDIIAAAERELGPLTRGERTDLLLDNMDEIKDCDEARAILDAIGGGAVVS